MRLAEIISPRDQMEEMVLENVHRRASKMLEYLEPPYH
jgi:hypothetical protein